MITDDERAEAAHNALSDSDEDVEEGATKEGLESFEQPVAIRTKVKLNRKAIPRGETRIGILHLYKCL